MEKYLIPALPKLEQSVNEIRYPQVRDEAYEFTIKVFEELSKQINPNIDIRMVFDNERNEFASLRDQTILFIDVDKFVNEFGYDKNYMKVSILKAIVHELYHSIQFIDYTKYEEDILNNYYIEIEAQVERKTISFLINNQPLLEQMFNVDISKYNNEFRFTIRALGNQGINFDYLATNLEGYYCNILIPFLELERRGALSSPKYLSTEVLKSTIINSSNIVLKYKSISNKNNEYNIIVKHLGEYNPNINCITPIIYDLYENKLSLHYYLFRALLIRTVEIDLFGNLFITVEPNEYMINSFNDEIPIVKFNAF